MMRGIRPRIFFCFNLSLTLCFLLFILPMRGITQGLESMTPVYSPPPNLSKEERGKLFDQVWRLINENYYDKQLNGVNWRRQRDLYRPKAENAQNTTELYRIFRQMIGKLGDAHTRIYSPDEGFDRFRPSGTTVGLIVRPIKNKPVVVWVDKASEAWRQGIRPGFILSSISGKSVGKIIETLRVDIGESSTAFALEHQVYDRLFCGSRDSVLNAVFLDGNGASYFTILARRFTEFQRRVTAQLLENEIGYIELTGFGPEIEADFDLAIRSMKGSKGLILDLRNNGGGFVTTVSEIAGYLFGPDVDMGEFITRQGKSTRRKSHKTGFVYNQPIIVLVSARSASGSEILAAAIQETGRGIIIGSNPTTCGCLLGVSRTLRLMDGGKLNISDTDFKTSSGQRIEKIGIKPDYVVEIRLEDLLASKDRALNEATDRLGFFIAFGAFGKNSYFPNFKLRFPSIFFVPKREESKAQSF